MVTKGRILEPNFVSYFEGKVLYTNEKFGTQIDHGRFYRIIKR
jgi:hypothetical protein